MINDPREAGREFAAEAIADLDSIADATRGKDWLWMDGREYGSQVFYEITGGDADDAYDLRARQALGLEPGHQSGDAWVQAFAEAYVTEYQRCLDRALDAMRG